MTDTKISDEVMGYQVVRDAKKQAKEEFADLRKSMIARAIVAANARASKEAKP